MEAFMLDVDDANSNGNSWLKGPSNRQSLKTPTTSSDTSDDMLTAVDAMNPTKKLNQEQPQ